VSTAVVDFRSSPSVDMDVENIHLGQATASGTGGFSGELQLATNGVNTITANVVRLGDSSSPGNTQVTSSLHLGAATNSLHVNWLYVGQRKSKGVMDILPGGTARMGGRTGGVMNLRVGFNNAGTASQAEGTFDMSGGHLDADFGSVVLGFHTSSTGNGRGTFVMDQGTVDAGEVFLAQVGTSSNPLNTRGTLIMNGGSFQVAGDVLDKGGASRLDLNQGRFAVRGDFVVDEVTLNAPTGGTTELELNALADDLTWKLGQYVQESNTTLRLKLAIENPVFQATNAHFEAGSLVDFAVAGTGLPNTNRADSSVWTGGTNVWDDVTSEHWSRWVPAGISLEPAGNVLIVAASNLVDNGLASAHPDWSIAVTPGPNGFITAAYAGPALPSGQIGAILDDAAASITRNGDLLLGDVPGSGAAATGVLMSGGELVVDGGVPHDGGYNYFLVDGGNVDVLNGGFDVDAFRLGYLNRSATLTVNGGAVRIGRPATPGLVDIGRREGNPSPALEHAGIGDFEDATGVRIDATELRIGSSDASNGPAFEGRLYLANSGMNEIHADLVTVADSPLQGQGAEAAILPPESLLNFGATTNDVTTDILTVAYRKSRGRALVPHGGVVNLWGKNTGTVELRLGYNAVNTGTISTGVLDAGLGILNGALSVLHIGRHDRGNGAGQGTLIMGGGLLTANRVDLARVSVTGTSTNPENTTACLALNGGSLHVAGAIQDLGGMSTLSIDGAEVHAASVDNLDNLSLLSGSLHVGALTGSPGFLMTGGRLSADRVDFNLNLAGGTLAPGASVGRSVIQGDHLLQEARWEIELDQATNDYVVVTGVLNLDPVDSSLDVVILNSGSNDVVIAEYGSLIGRFANENIPAGYAVDYAYQGSGRIALVPTTEFSMESQVGFAGGMAEISWQSTAGERYSVWRTHRLQPSDWIRIASGLADSAPRNSFTDPKPGGQRAYYRIERE
jgi:hypothetical protein